MAIFNALHFRAADPQQDLAKAYDIFRRTISPYVMALNNGVWPEEERYPFFKKGFNEPGMHMIESDGQVIGCYNITENQDAVILQRVYLEPEFQRCGIGRYLITLALQQAHQSRKPLELEVLENNIQAIRSYEKNGFLPYGGVVVNGWNRKFSMRHKDTDKYAARPVLSAPGNPGPVFGTPAP